ncbi:MAG: hypothetical protein QMB52_11570 [Propionivibrio sp.]
MLVLIQPRLFQRTYIPIRPVLLLPDEAKRLKRKLAQQRYRAKKGVSDVLTPLQFPLLWYEDPAVEIEDRSSVEELEVETGPEAIAVGPEVDEPVVWTNDEILTLSSVLIEESLKALAARANPSEKWEILGWIFESDIVEEIVVQTPYGPRKKIIHADQVPFTFAFCCKLAGYDPSVYRAFVRRTVPEVANQFIHHELEDEPGIESLRYQAPTH